MILLISRLMAYRVQQLCPSPVPFSTLPTVGSVCRSAFVASASKIGIAVAGAVGYVLGPFQLGRIAGLGSSDRFPVGGSILPQVVPIRCPTSFAPASVMDIGVALPMLDPRHSDRS